MLAPSSLTGLLLSVALPAAALPWPPPIKEVDELVEYNSTISARADAGDFYLRIMPLGASIVAGDYSQDSAKNGFRKFVRDKLREQKWKVNMVGSLNSGTMADNVSCKHNRWCMHRTDFHYRTTKLSRERLLNKLPNVVESLPTNGYQMWY